MSSVVASLAPHAYEAASWTAEHLAPWALQQVGRFRRARREKQRLEAISRIADSLTLDEIVHVAAVCRPQSEHGIANDELRFDIEIISIAPVGIRPVRLEKPSCSLLVPLGSMAPNIVVDERPVAIDDRFLRTGRRCLIPIRVPIKWSGAPPALGMAASIGISGELVVHGPWREEHRRVEFGAKVFARVV